MRKASFLLAVCMVFAISQQLAFSGEKQEFKLGGLLPLSGAAATFGRYGETGIQLAVEQLSPTFQGKGLSLNVIYEDSKMDPALGVSAMKKLTQLDKTIAVIGSGSGVLLAAAPIADQQRVPLINHGALDPRIPNAGEYVFSLVADANQEAESLTRAIKAKFCYERLAILYSASAYGESSRNSMKTAFQNFGGTVVSEVPFSENAPDLAPLLRKIMRSRPQAIFFIATVQDFVNILLQAKQIELNLPLFSFNAFESQDILDKAKSAAEGVIFTSSNVYDLPKLSSNVMKRFLERYIARFGEKPNNYCAAAYDAVYLVANAILDKKRTGEEIKDYLLSVKDYQGASGIITFNAVGGVRKPLLLKWVKDGRFVTYDPWDARSMGD